jgi:glycosyltransferase involved in cell wall biosynthesis
VSLRLTDRESLMDAAPGKMKAHEVSETAVPVRASATAAPSPAVSPDGGFGLSGKRVGMLLFSTYPYDPRPRRAIEALRKEGMTIDLICLAEENAPRRERLDGIDVVRVPITQERGGKFSYAYRYSAFILVSAAILAWRSLWRRYDLIYVNNMPDILVLSGLIPKAFGAKLILDQHDPMPELANTIFGIKDDSVGVAIIKKLEKWSLARADLVLTVNIACQRIFGTRSCPPGKIGVVMNSPDEDIFPLRTPRSYASRSHSGKDRFVIMYHGSLVERNGLDLAVDALALVKDAVPSAELRIYGRKTPFLEQVMGQARGKGVEANIRYLGSRTLEQLVGDIEDCDVGVIPNRSNPFTDINTPTRIFEYLALGKPVIAPRTLGITDYFSPQSLVFFESGDARDLAQRIEYVFAHSDEATAIAERGQQIYLAHRWQEERMTLLGLVSGLLKGEHKQ